MRETRGPDPDVTTARRRRRSTSRRPVAGPAARSTSSGTRLPVPRRASTTRGTTCSATRSPLAADGRCTAATLAAARSSCSGRSSTRRRTDRPSGDPTCRVTLVGKTVTKISSAADVRPRLGLRSTSFRLGVLRARAVAGATPAGRRYRLEGLARDVDEPWLENARGRTALGARRQGRARRGRDVLRHRPPEADDDLPAHRRRACGPVALTITVPAGVLRDPGSSRRGACRRRRARRSRAAQAAARSRSASRPAPPVPRSAQRARARRRDASRASLRSRRSSSVEPATQRLQATARRPLRRAAAPAGAGLLAERPVPPAAVVPDANRAFDAWTALPPLAPVRVAVIDSGRRLRATPSSRGRIVAARRASSAAPAVDTQGHGTFVAGLIAAETDNGVGIAGLCAACRAAVAKVVERRRHDPGRGRGARRSAGRSRRGARVINMSLGGVRDPLDPEPRHVLAARGGRRRVRGLEGRARRGRRRQRRPVARRAVALRELAGRAAARGRRERARAQRGRRPRSRTVTRCSTTSPPRARTSSRRSRARSRGSARRAASRATRLCATGGVPHRRGNVLRRAAGERRGCDAALACRPSLPPDQVTALLERTAVDATAGERLPALRRRAATRSRAAGTLDVTAALERARRAGARRATARAERRRGASAHTGSRARGDGGWIDATLDYWDDRDDVYAVYLREGERLDASLDGGGRRPSGAGALAPGTRVGAALASQAGRVRRLCRAPGAASRSATGRRAAGWYLLARAASRTPGVAVRIGSRLTKTR